MLTAELRFFLDILKINLSHSPGDPSFVGMTYGVANFGNLVIPRQVALDWDAFYCLVREHRVWHQVVPYLKHYPEVPVGILNKLQNLCNLDKLRILKTAKEVVRISREFIQQGIQHCFLKGVILNEMLYGNLCLRHCRDIDLWIPVTLYKTSIAILQNLGYQKQAPAYNLTGFQESFHLSHRHEIVLYHPDYQVYVELHFRLVDLGINFFEPTPETCHTLPLFKAQIATLQHDYHLTYLIIHGAKHGFTRLKWLYDIALYFKSGKSQLNQIFNLAAELKCEHIVDQTLLLLQQHFNYSPTNISYTPSKTSTALAKYATTFIANNYNLVPTTNLYHKKMFMLYRIYLIKLTARGSKLKTLRQDLFKIDELFRYITLPRSLSLLYYLIYPVWIVKRIIAQTIGKRSNRYSG